MKHLKTVAYLADISLLEKEYQRRKGEITQLRKEVERKEDEVALLRKDINKKNDTITRLEQENQEFKIQRIDSLRRGHICYLADQGDAHAQWEMGRIYDRGLYEVEANNTKAAEWYTKSAAQDHPMALGALGHYYSSGVIGGKPDYRMAIALWQRAANAGEVISMADIGVSYWNGDAVKEDLSIARQWWRKGANMDDDLCKLRLCSGDTEAKEIVAECEKGASRSSLEEIAYMYSANGLGLPRDLSAAGLWHARAVSMHNSVYSRFHLYRMYGEGNGVLKDDNKSFHYLRQAAGLDYSIAQYELAQMYASGEGVSKNIGEAKRLYTRAAEQGHVKAQADLAVCVGAEGNWPFAIRWCRHAALLNDSNAQYNLFRWQRQGNTHGLLDFDEALHWYRPPLTCLSCPGISFYVCRLARSAMSEYREAVRDILNLNHDVLGRLMYDCKAARDILK